MSSDEQLDWNGIGYGRGIAACTGGNLNTLYPYRDQFSVEDENAFIAGYNQALMDFATTGLRTAEFYVQEKGMRP